MLPLHFCTADADRSNGRLAPGLRRHPSTPGCNTFLPRKQDSYSWGGHTSLGLLQPWFLPPPEIFVSSPQPPLRCNVLDWGGETSVSREVGVPNRRRASILGSRRLLSQEIVDRPSRK